MSDHPVSTWVIIAALGGDRDALKAVRGGANWSWARTVEGDAAAKRLTELERELENLRADWSPPRGQRTPGVPPWQGGQRLERPPISNNQLTEEDSP